MLGIVYGGIVYGGIVRNNSVVFVVLYLLISFIGLYALIKGFRTRRSPFQKDLLGTRLEDNVSLLWAQIVLALTYQIQL